MKRVDDDRIEKVDRLTIAGHSGSPLLLVIIQGVRSGVHDPGPLGAVFPHAQRADAVKIVLVQLEIDIGYLPV